MHGRPPTDRPRLAARVAVTPTVAFSGARRLALLGAFAAAVLALAGCGRSDDGTATATAAAATGAASSPSAAAIAALEVTETPTPTPTPTATATATASATAAPTSAATNAPSAAPASTSRPAAPAPTVRASSADVSIEVDPPVVGQGETMRVRVRGAASGSIVVRGLVHSLIPGSGEAWAVIGIPIDARLGSAPITARPLNATGAPLAEVGGTYTVGTVERPIDYLTLTEEQGAVLSPEAGVREIQLRRAQFSYFDSAPRWNGKITRPIRGAYYVSTAFGQARSINGGPVEGFHTGQDLAADHGAAVYASAPGRVVFAAAMPIRGNAVVLDHGGGVMTGYHHLSTVNVDPGQIVEAGALIGEVGSTGLATGPHLHWELTIYGVNVDPETWVHRSFAP